MQIGDPIIKQITAVVARLEKQFNAFEMIDDFDLGKNGPDTLLQSVTKFLRSISDCKTAHLFFKHSESIDHFFAYPNLASVLPIAFEDAFFPSSGKQVKLLKRSKNEKCYLICKIDSEAVPTCYIILQDSYFGRASNTIQEPEFQKYADVLIGKIIRKFQNASQRTRLENFQNLTKKVMTRRIGNTGNIETWIEMLSPVSGYLPNWGPYRFSGGLPKTQLLRVLTGRRFLQVVSETDGRAEDGIPVPEKAGLSLRREKTICGIILDNEDIGEPDPYIRVDPRDYPDRYASILYDDDSHPPKSQLALPIRINKKTVAILNLEHETKRAFSNFHVEKLLELVSDLDSFVVHAITGETQKIDQEKELRYVIMKVASRVAQYESHKFNNQFSVYSSWLNFAKEAIEGGEFEKAKKHIDTAIEESRSISETKTSFFKSVKEFVSFTDISLKKMVVNAIAEFGKRGSESAGATNDLSKDSIQLEKPEIDEGTKVFSSGLAVEHLYNILQNAREQIVLYRKSNQDFVGIIQIDYQSFSASNPLKNIESLPMHRLSISDNAGGVSHTIRERIFERGFTHGKTHGTGFGLGAARDYFLKIGGDVVLKKDTNEMGGATFDVIFPGFEPGLHEDLANKLNLTGLTD